MSETDALHPLLARYPDARRGTGRLFDPILFPYIGLIFGFGAALLAVYNAWRLRRMRLALLSILIGLAGCFLFVVTFVVARQVGVQNSAVALIIGRAVHFALGSLMFFIHRPHFRGHEFQDGETVPVMQSYLGAVVLSIIVPWRVTVVLLGGLFVR
jgi:hypothetical protein